MIESQDYLNFFILAKKGFAFELQEKFKIQK
jgi:hypothetical protein